LLALNPPISHIMETSEPGHPAQDPIATPVPSTEPTSAPEHQNQADQQKPSTNDEADEDSDFDELDGAILPLTLPSPSILIIADVLDDFSKPKAAEPATATATAPAPTSATNSTGVAPADFDEDAFLKQLEKDMANLMGNAPGMPSDQPDFQGAVDQGADIFAKQLEESGIPPGDFLKQLLADVMAEEGSGAGSGTGSAKASPAPPSAPSAPTAAAAAAAAGEPESFNDAIQRTMERMKESGNKATEAATEDDGSDDMLAQLLKAVEAGAAGAGEDGDLTKMFMGMMEQLSNKEMLYEPMKELDGKFEPWIKENKEGGKVAVEDMERYETQAKIVKQIVLKFEEPGYTDDDAKCREYIWERMQEVRWSRRCCVGWALMLTISTDASRRQPARGTDLQPAHGGPWWSRWHGRCGRRGRRRRTWRSPRLSAAIKTLKIGDHFDTHSCSSACSVLYIYTTMSIPLFTPRHSLIINPNRNAF
jgi:peroxin-19